MMAANKGIEKLEKLFDEIIEDISENGTPISHAVKDRMSISTFYILLEDESRSKRYARATELRAEKLACETLTIADDIKGDVNRDRLRVDARKWLLAKLSPKKYGDKIEHEHTGGITLHFDSDDKNA